MTKLMLAPQSSETHRALNENAIPLGWVSINGVVTLCSSCSDRSVSVTRIEKRQTICYIDNSWNMSRLCANLYWNVCGIESLSWDMQRACNYRYLSYLLLSSLSLWVLAQGWVTYCANKPLSWCQIMSGRHEGVNRESTYKRRSVCALRIKGKPVMCTDSQGWIHVTANLRNHDRWNYRSRRNRCCHLASNSTHHNVFCTKHWQNNVASQVYFSTFSWLKSIKNRKYWATWFVG